MKTNSARAKLMSLILVAGALTFCPASYAQIKKAAHGTTRQSFRPLVTDQSDPTPSVHIRMQIPDVLNREIDIFGYDQQSNISLGDTSGGGGGEGKLIAGPVTISKRIDEYTPLFNRIHASGEHVREIVLQWFRVDPSGMTDRLFFTITLNDVLISAIHRNLPNQQDPAFARLGEVEALSLVYKSMQMTAAVPDAAP